MMIIYLTMASMIFTITCAGGPNLDNCDWTGSGTLAMALSRGVQPVYLRCNQGTVRWHYPQGALRIVLQHRSAGSSFSACVRRSKNSTGARIYLAGHKTLHQLFNSNDPIDLVKCVSSQSGQVTLYAEADPIADILRKATAEFSYHLKRIYKKTEYAVIDECQPCSEEQLLRHFCSSDFVVQGTVTSLFHNKALQMTELTVRVSQILRTNKDLNNPIRESHISSDNDIVQKTNYVVMYRPLKCGTKAGSGEYLFLGKWLLGNANLNCVPRVSEWKKVRRKALLTGSNECLL
ncbi:meteorin-like protein [Parasteatoda tepidariorum]|uniref:meteorin-like protein n=1 Tax=Parasteatoda tepidariorum TaxID=114398 RepID=UPI00077F8BAE|nr:meteorin-like protein [Parasteatoda tepidariorum]